MFFAEDFSRAALARITAGQVDAGASRRRFLEYQRHWPGLAWPVNRRAAGSYGICGLFRVFVRLRHQHAPASRRVKKDFDRLLTLSVVSPIGRELKEGCQLLSRVLKPRVVESSRCICFFNTLPGRRTIN